MLYRRLTSILSSCAELSEASALAFMLLEKKCGMSRTDVLMERPCPCEDEVIAMAHRVAAHEPIQYVLGETDFAGLTFAVTPDVLIPRPETQELVEWIRDDNVNEETLSILDIGTGSGCIAVTLKTMFAQAYVEAWDVSESALSIAELNARRNEVELVTRRVDVLAETVSSQRRFDVIVSNPPYICNAEAVDMERNVLDHEPHLALFVPDDDPLLFYRSIATHAKNLLRDGGKLYFEINRSYGDAVSKMLRDMGYSNVVLRQDTFGNDRMISAAPSQYPPKGKAQS